MGGSAGARNETSGVDLGVQPYYVSAWRSGMPVTISWFLGSVPDEADERCGCSAAGARSPAPSGLRQPGGGGSAGAKAGGGGSVVDPGCTATAAPCLGQHSAREQTVPMQGA